jgi:hypothetical protein
LGPGHAMSLWTPKIDHEIMYLSTIVMYLKCISGLKMCQIQNVSNPKCVLVNFGALQGRVESTRHVVQVQTTKFSAPRSSQGIKSDISL